MTTFIMWFLEKKNIIKILVIHFKKIKNIRNKKVVSSNHKFRPPAPNVLRHSVEFFFRTTIDNPIS